MSRAERIEKLKDELITRRDALSRALAGDLSALQTLNSQSSGDILDAALDSAQDEVNSQLVEVESRELGLIDKALLCMGDGTYGVCELTGKSIPIERLEALPYATMTVEAQRLSEKAEADGTSEDPEWNGTITIETDDTLPSFDEFNFA